MKRAVPVAVTAFAAYIAIAIAITFPLVARLTTYFPGNPGDNDVFGFIWNNWWVPHALVHLHRSPFVTDYLFAQSFDFTRLPTFRSAIGMRAVGFRARHVAGQLIRSGSRSARMPTQHWSVKQSRTSSQDEAQPENVSSRIPGHARDWRPSWTCAVGLRRTSRGSTGISVDAATHPYCSDLANDAMTR